MLTHERGACMQRTGGPYGRADDDGGGCGDNPGGGARFSANRRLRGRPPERVAPVIASVAPAEPTLVALADLDEAQPFACRMNWAVAAIADDMRDNGQQTPIVVRASGSGFQVINGHRRVLAARKLKWSHVMTVVVDAAADEQAFALALCGHRITRPLSPIERALAVQRARRFGLSVDWVAQQLGLGRRQLSNLQQLLRLPTAVQRAVDAGELPPTHAVRMLAFQRRVADLDLVWFCDRVCQHGWSARRLGREMRDLHGAPGDRAFPGLIDRARSAKTGRRWVLACRAVDLDSLTKAERALLICDARELIAAADGQSIAHPNTELV